MLQGDQVGRVGGRARQLRHRGRDRGPGVTPGLTPARGPGHRDQGHRGLEAGGGARAADVDRVEDVGRGEARPPIQQGVKVETGGGRVYADPLYAPQGEGGEGQRDRALRPHDRRG